MTTRTDSTATGTLQIGDQWNAITIIAHSQTHPLKAICELTENAIDAGAKTVRIIRRRRQGEAFIEFEDDGRGVAADGEGRPDFERIATHLCDSMKRRLDAPARRGVHGEFGIGLLSFWSLGENLTMTSAGRDGRARELRLIRGQREYQIRPVGGLLAASGTQVVVGPLLEATRNLVTGEKIARYLSAELRDRIRRSGVQILVVDNVARKRLAVKPREFAGERLEIPRRYATPLGDVQVEVYLQDESGTGSIALCKDGTRVLPRISDLLSFQGPPWTDGRIEGIIDFEPLALAPGTRGGVVADAALETLASTGEAIARDMLAALAERDEAEAERASQQLLKQVHKAFTSALSQLPAEEYLYFDIPKPGAARQAAEPGSVQPGLFRRDPGPPATVMISPRHPRHRPGEEVRLSARVVDADSHRISEGVSLHWRIVSGTAWLTADAAACLVHGDQEGLATVEVLARQGDVEVRDRVEVRCVRELPASVSPSRRGLPSYRLAAEPGQLWRSRYDAAVNEIVINSAHRDFLASRSSAGRHRRYIGKLYAKEVVLSNFPDGSPAEALERLVELTLRTDDAL
ncbi:MAG: ATP-binding protein [Planctomycetota bacterium]|jgi:hypothetical protein|nr:ATP-binding protein [Planctomycetota bacterium]MDA1200134.1 ATP-binding protein [Planctomycetota bacterium]